mgnify:CR=1 FL=1
MQMRKMKMMPKSLFFRLDKINIPVDNKGFMFVVDSDIGVKRAMHRLLSMAMLAI